MKKIYEEPMIVVEQYALTQNVAACETKVGFNDNECVLKDPQATDQMKDLAGVGFFNAGTNGCAEGNHASDMDGFDALCYHTNAAAAFTS